MISGLSYLDFQSSLPHGELGWVAARAMGAMCTATPCGYAYRYIAVMRAQPLGRTETAPPRPQLFQRLTSMLAFSLGLCILCAGGPLPSFGGPVQQDIAQHPAPPPPSSQSFPASNGRVHDAPAPPPSPPAFKRPAPEFAPPPLPSDTLGMCVCISTVQHCMYIRAYALIACMSELLRACTCRMIGMHVSCKPG